MTKSYKIMIQQIIKKKSSFAKNKISLKFSIRGSGSKVQLMKKKATEDLNTVSIYIFLKLRVVFGAIITCVIWE